MGIQTFLNVANLAAGKSMFLVEMVEFFPLRIANSLVVRAKPMAPLAVFEYGNDPRFKFQLIFYLGRFCG